MKLQIDTQNKTITIVEDVKLQELNEFIRLAIPESELGNWKINASKEVIQSQPIIIEKWREQPWGRWYPWWECPGTIPNPIWYEVTITNQGTGTVDIPFNNNTNFTVELR